MDVRTLLIHGEDRARRMAEMAANEKKDWCAAQFVELAALFHTTLNAVIDNKSND